MSYQIDLQSASDLITNSSNECFLIISDLPDKTFREMWDKQLKDWGYTEEEIETDSSIYGEIWMENGRLYLDYPVMCNIKDEHDIIACLKKWFGYGNVTRD